MISYIIAFLWVTGFILVLWRISLAVINLGTVKYFYPFFMYAVLFQITAVFFYYEMWTTDMWIVFKFLWLGCFVVFFAHFLKLLRKGVL